MSTTRLEPVYELGSADTGSINTLINDLFQFAPMHFMPGGDLSAALPVLGAHLIKDFGNMEVLLGQLHYIISHVYKSVWDLGI